VGLRCVEPLLLGSCVGLYSNENLAEKVSAHENEKDSLEEPFSTLEADYEALQGEAKSLHKKSLESSKETLHQTLDDTIHAQINAFTLVGKYKNDLAETLDKAIKTCKGSFGDVVAQVGFFYKTP